MTIKKLKPIKYRATENCKHFDIYRPDGKAQDNTKAVIFAQIVLDTDEAIRESLLASDHPRMAYLAPNGYELYAVKGHLSDYNATEYFDICNPGEHYNNHHVSPPESDIFIVDDGNNCNLMCSEDDFDAIIIKHPLKIFDLLNTGDFASLYRDILFHCSRPNGCQNSMKYFLPVEQHAHILAHSKPLEWVRF